MTSVVFHCIWDRSLCDLYLAVVQIFCKIYMAFFYFIIGPMFDFLYLVMIYAVFVNRMIGVYDPRKGKGMEMVVAIMKGYIIFVIILMLLYTARHFYFTIVHSLGRQRLYYNDTSLQTG